ncbi:hypothetical protein ACQP0C_20320 [Nocardia sp. CA-129566]|uniref:hypothetical protein n=1 Tax=Nocardia sp. CA-129566 TaxID=3239976 RepID=UPI003D99B681
MRGEGEEARKENERVVLLALHDLVTRRIADHPLVTVIIAVSSTINRRTTARSRAGQTLTP